MSAPAEDTPADTADDVLTGPDGPLLRHPGSVVRPSRRPPPGAGRVPGGQVGDQPVVTGRFDELEVRDVPRQPLAGRGLHRLGAAGLVHPPALPLVPAPVALEDRVVSDPGDHPPGPPIAPRPVASWDLRVVQPVGDLVAALSGLKPADPLVVDRLRVGVLPDVGVGLRAGRLGVPEGEGLYDPALLELIPEAATDALRRVLVAALMLESGEEGAQPPVLVGGVEAVVDGDETGVVVLAQLAEVDSPVPPTDAPRSSVITKSDSRVSMAAPASASSWRSRYSPLPRPWMGTNRTGPGYRSRTNFSHRAIWSARLRASWWMVLIRAMISTTSVTPL